MASKLKTQTHNCLPELLKQTGRFPPPSLQEEVSNTHRHTSFLLPPNKPLRQREIPVTKIQLKQLICTDISSRAFERCTAEPLPHSTIYCRALTPSTATVGEGHRGRLLIYHAGWLIKLHSWCHETEHESQNKAARRNFPCFRLWSDGILSFILFKFFLLRKVLLFSAHLQMNPSLGASCESRFDVHF